MWVNSKTAAAVFGVNHNSIVQAVSRATKQGKKICSVKCHICHFMYSNGIGRGGKVLQIWIDDSVIAEFESKNGVRLSINGISQGVDGACGLVDSENLQGYQNGKFANLHGMSENIGDLVRGSVGVSADSVSGAVGVSGLVGVVGGACGGLQNANLRVSENGIIQGGGAVMDERLLKPFCQRRLYLVH